MPEPTNTLKPVVTHDIQSAAETVIQIVRRNAHRPFLLDAKLGDANTAPMPDTQIASTYDTPQTSIKDKMARIISDLVRTDQEHGNPLGQIAQRANDLMARAAIINPQNRRPPLYSEVATRTFVEMGLAAPEHLPLIRAAGYVSPPPSIPRSHDIDHVIRNIAAHMAGTDQPQTPTQIIEALHYRHEDFNRWPQFDITLFILRTAGIMPDERGNYHPDQPWGELINGQQLVNSTTFRILTRDQRPATTAYLVDEVERLAGAFLPKGYNTGNAVRNAVRNESYTSAGVSGLGRATFGLTEWTDDATVRNVDHRGGRTGDGIHAFLVENGPAHVEDIIEHVQRTTGSTGSAIQDAINHDDRDRFIRLSDRRVAANPILDGHGCSSGSLEVVPDDEKEHEPIPVLRESELLWLTHYVQGLNQLTPPLPSGVAITGARAAGFAHEGDTLEITVVADPKHWPTLDPRLAYAATVATQAVPSVRPQFRILSPEQWERQQAGEPLGSHHYVWLTPSTSQ